MLRFRRLTWIVLLVAMLATAGCGATSAGQTGTAARAAKRVELAADKNPVAAKGRTLALSVVSIPAGVRLPLHHHEGTQVAFVQTGILVYTVKSGRVSVMSGPADQSPKLVRTIGPGQTGEIGPGQWIVEQPSTIHYAQAKTNVVVALATLLRNGAPLATPVK